MKKKTCDDGCFSRRSFLKASAAFAGSTLLGSLPLKAFADQAAIKDDRCFVFVYFRGGWDQLLGLDPRDPAVFTADRISETKIYPGYELINDSSYPTTMVTPKQRPGGPVPAINFGPAIGNLADHYDLCAVVRGINMATVAHEVGYKYFLTGKSPAGTSPRGSSTATEVVGQIIPRRAAAKKPVPPIPSLAYNVDSYNDRYPGAASALKVARNSDLLLTLAASPTQLDSDIEKSLLDLRGKPITCEADLFDSRGLVSAYQTSRGQVQDVLAQKLSDSFDFTKTTAANQALWAAYGFTASGVDTPGGRAALAATALKKRISQCVSITINTGVLDTHFGPQKTQADSQRAGWNAIAAMVKDLRETAFDPNDASQGSFMDHTTVLVFSEFARTPLLNPYGGRDHHITSSALLIGAGIKGNSVVGASGDIAMTPSLIDLRTGKADPNGRNIFPEEVIATVLASAGLDYAITRTSPLSSILA